MEPLLSSGSGSAHHFSRISSRNSLVGGEIKIAGDGRLFAPNEPGGSIDGADIVDEPLIKRALFEGKESKSKPPDC